jgi:hypothetical protein
MGAAFQRVVEQPQVQRVHAAVDRQMLDVVEPARHAQVRWRRPSNGDSRGTNGRTHGSRDIS